MENFFESEWIDYSELRVRESSDSDDVQFVSSSFNAPIIIDLSEDDDDDDVELVWEYNIQSPQYSPSSPYGCISPMYTPSSPLPLSPESPPTESIIGKEFLLILCCKF